MNQDRINLLKKYIGDEPHDPFNYYALAMEYYEELPGEALELLEQLVDLQPDYLPTYFKLAHLYWEFELWDKAETAFKRGIEWADEQQDSKALSELRSTYQNFLFERG